MEAGLVIIGEAGEDEDEEEEGEEEGLVTVNVIDSGRGAAPVA